MKTRFVIPNNVLFILLFFFVTFFIGCSNEELFSIGHSNRILNFNSHIELMNIENGLQSAFEKKQFKEAAERFSSRLILNEDNTFALLEGATAAELNISNNLFELFHSVIIYWNTHPASLIIKSDKQLTRTKGNNPESSSTLGGNLLCDIAASAIYYTIVSNGWDLTANLFHMWYFDNRSSAYSLTEQEWTPISIYSNGCVGADFCNDAFEYDETTYYQNEISFYGSSSDLRYSLGSSIVSFNSNGQSVGLLDFYNFNSGDLSFVDANLISVIHCVGNNGGFAINYGIVNH